MSKPENPTPESEQGWADYYAGVQRADDWTEERKRGWDKAERWTQVAEAELSPSQRAEEIRKAEIKGERE